MMAAEQRIAVMTSDPAFRLPTDGASGRLAIERQPWRDAAGPLHPQALAAQMLDGDPAVVCFAPDVPVELALEVGGIIDRHRSGVEAVLVHAPSAELWKQATRVGIRDLVAPESIDTDLLTSIEVALDRTERIRAAMVTSVSPLTARSKVIVVLSPKGGSGKTMLATNLAVALAASGAGDVALVDLDCVFGDVASVLGLTSDHTIGQLATLGGFDSTTLKVFLTRHEQSGLFVLPSSGAPEEGEQVDASVAARAIELLGQDFSHIVVDTSAGLDERALAAIDLATDIVLLASLDVASVRNLAKEVDALDRLDLTGATRHFVLNRADARVGIEVAEVEAALGMQVAAALPSTRLVPLSMNQGRSIVLDDPTSPVSQQLAALAARFAPQQRPAVAGAQARRSRLFRRR